VEEQHSSGAQQAAREGASDDSQAARVLEELLSELRAGEERTERAASAAAAEAAASSARQRSSGQDSLTRAAREEAGALGAAVSRYRGMQAQQMHAALCPGALLALPQPAAGSSRHAESAPPSQPRHGAAAEAEPVLAPLRRMLEAFDADAPVQAPLPPFDAEGPLPSGDAFDSAQVGMPWRCDAAPCELATPGPLTACWN
jgi:hypothetical protein